MKRIHISRRDFLKTTGFALSLISPSRSNSLAETMDERSSKNTKINIKRIKNVLDDMEAKGFRFMSVPRKDGEFLNLLVKLTRTKKALEIGTSQGFSAIWIGMALEETDGHLTTIEIDRERYAIARKNIIEAGLSHRISCINGDAHVEVNKIDGHFDFIFLDADKEGQVDYFNKLYPKKLPPGGIILSHNAINQAHYMKDYLELIKRHPDFQTVIISVTMDDGFSISYRHRQ